ncbi:hypothetical protein HD806DRAFT_528561 [Xylariaceae sp. AK1471]|nr:hypothetical protein HD806DRAFT_528561 [Xylariaceae sp. AK1471]
MWFRAKSKSGIQNDTDISNHVDSATNSSDIYHADDDLADTVDGSSVITGKDNIGSDSSTVLGSEHLMGDIMLCFPYTFSTGDGQCQKC